MIIHYPCSITWLHPHESYTSLHGKTLLLISKKAPKVNNCLRLLNRGWSVSIRRIFHNVTLTLSWQRSLSYRKQSTDLQSKSMDWFLHDRELHHERVKVIVVISHYWKIIQIKWMVHPLTYIPFNSFPSKSSISERFT